MSAALPIIPCCSIAMDKALQDCRRDKGAHHARQVAEGYLRGVVGFMQRTGDRQSTYDLVQSIADELAAQIIEKRG